VVFEVSLTVHVPLAAALALGEDVGVAVVTAAVAVVLALGGFAAPPHAASRKPMPASGTAIRDR
jgi:uncharacterized membrane protein (UPF0136 family)